MRRGVVPRQQHREGVDVLQHLQPVGGLLLVIGAERFDLRAQARAVSHARRP